MLLVFFLHCKNPDAKNKTMHYSSFDICHTTKRTILLFLTKCANHYIRQSTANSQTNVQHSTILTSASCHFMSSCSMLSFSPLLCLNLLGCPKSAHFICTIIWLLAVDNLKKVIYRPCFWCFM